MTQKPPRWDLTNIYPSLESTEFASAISRQVDQIEALEKVFASQVSAASAETPLLQLAALVGQTLEQLNQAFELAGTIRPYLHSFVATDSRNTLARKKLSEYEQLGVRLEKVSTQFQAWIGRLGTVLDEIIQANPTAAGHAFGLREAAEPPAPPAPRGPCHSRRDRSPGGPSRPIPPW